jgi:hypothetical protein
MYTDNGSPLFRPVGVFPCQIISEDSLIALAREPNQIEILGVGFNPPLRRFRQGFQQLLIDEHKPGRQPTAVEMINTRLAGFASAP